MSEIIATPEAQAHAAAQAQGAQERYRAAMAHIQAGLHELEGAILGLPQIPTATSITNLRQLDEEWEHDGHDLRVVTEGIAQWCKFDLDDHTASTDGWDDMGDMDGPAYLLCIDCGVAFQAPSDMDWN